MYFLGYSFTTLWIFFRSLQISWATLYIIFQTYDEYPDRVRLVFDCRSACIRLPFGLCPIVVQLMFYNAFSIHFERHDNVMSQSLLSNEGVRMFDFCYLTCVCACVRNASRFSSYKVKWAFRSSNPDLIILSSWLSFSLLQPHRSLHISAKLPSKSETLK